MLTDGIRLVLNFCKLRSDVLRVDASRGSAQKSDRLCDWILNPGKFLQCLPDEIRKPGYLSAERIDIAFELVECAGFFQRLGKRPGRLLQVCDRGFRFIELLFDLVDLCLRVVKGTGREPILNL